MKRPSYIVVSHALLALAAFGLLVDAMRGMIPPPKPNRLRFETSDFLALGSRSAIDWWPLGETAFAEARRLGRPVLLLIGATWSKAGRDAEAYTFSDREVVSFLNRYMVCIRVDSQAAPRWLSAFLPLRRLATGSLHGFQLWFLTPEGQLFDSGMEIGTTAPIEPDAFEAVLHRARERLRAIRLGGLDAPTPGLEQASDEAALTRPSLPAPLDFRTFEAKLSGEAGIRFGGKLRYGRVIPIPTAMLYLVLRGQPEAFRTLADAFYRSPLVDWLDGGIFRSYVAAAPISVEFDKTAFQNAEVMAVLARAGAAWGASIDAQFAQRTFDALARDFIQNGLIAGCQIGDEKHRGRSERRSFSPRRLRALLTPEERDAARADLGLRVEDNPPMSIWMAQPELAFESSSPAARVLAKLQDARRGEVKYGGRRQLDVHGFVVARMLESARLWGDQARLRFADELFTRLDWFLAGDDVKHTLEDGVPDEPYLGDYLAFADACLQHYLSFGSSLSLERGLSVLQRARLLFESDVPGVWRTSLRRASPLEPKNVDVPEIADFVRESCTATAIRLCNTYGRLLRDSDPRHTQLDSDAIILIQAAQTTVGQVSAIAPTLGVDGAGLFCSALRVMDDAHLIVVGPGCLEKARELAARLPHRLVAPALARVRPTLQKGQAGVYIVRGNRVEGPVSEDLAVKRLGRPRSR